MKTEIRNRVLKAAGLISMLVIGGSAQAAPPVGEALPAPKIATIDRALVMRNSLVGQDIARQVQKLSNDAKADLKGRENALRKEAESLQRQMAILSASMQEQKRKAFEAKQQAFQQAAEEKQYLIQGGVLKAQKQVDAALRPILEGILRERGANLLVDRSAVIMSTVDFDVTDVAVARLNQKLKSLKVTLGPPPNGAQGEQ